MGRDREAWPWASLLATRPRTTVAVCDEKPRPRPMLSEFEGHFNSGGLGPGPPSAMQGLLTPVGLCKASGGPRAQGQSEDKGGGRWLHVR